MTKSDNRHADAHREVETKLDADPNLVLPELAGLPGVARVEDGSVEELEAVYYDASDLRLIRAGLTLRRRTGGSDAGWHLKLPEKGARVEVHRPLGRGRTVPAPLLALAKSRLRGTPIAPVAKITTHRRQSRLLGADDHVLAVVADDEVTAETMGEEVTVSTWRELEVELAEGDETLLDAAVAALRDAGARPAATGSKLARALNGRLQGLPGSARTGKAAERRKTRREGSAGDVAMAHLQAQFEALAAQDPRVRLDQEDAVHQMRVATRRLRSALVTFRSLLDREVTEPLRGELKWLADLLGAARDAEVMHARLLSEVDDQPGDLVVGPVREQVDAELSASYRTAHAAVVRALNGPRYAQLLQALDGLVTTPPLSRRAARPARPELRKRIRREHQRVERLAAEARSVQDHREDHDTRLHEVRKSAKRARYAGESVKPVFGKDAKRFATAMESIQEALGDHQDTVVLRQLLRDLAAKAHASGDDGFTYGRLHALAEARAEQDEADFEAAWLALEATASRWPA